VKHDEEDGPQIPGIEKQKTSWFGPKRFGLGFRPASWQGWVLVIGIVLLVVLLRHFAL
jgi:hypothetical protein